MNPKITPFLTIFTAPKPFIDAHISMIQRNAIRSWLQLGKDVEIVLIGDEPGIAETARDLNVKHIKVVDKNADGTPLVSSIFMRAREVNESPLLAYINADIITLPDFLESARQIAAIEREFLVVGQRWDMNVTSELNFKTGWDQDLANMIRKEGDLHRPLGSDYFIFPRNCFTNIPDFAIGRAGWDNWMIFKGRWEGWKVINATGAIDIIHQEHDYRHLPNGQPHYRLPESTRNTYLAGGKRAIFNLIDSDWIFADGKISRPKATREKILREFEVFPLINLHSFFLGEVFYWLFHFQKAFWEWRASLKNQEARPHG